MFIFLALLQVAASQPLNLTCLGGGTANKVTVSNSYGYGSGSGMVGGTPFSYNGSATGSTYGHRSQGFADQVDIRLFGGDDRIRMPRTMLPPIHGGSDGWFQLKDVVADARSVRAKVAVNFMNSPKLFIDRVTGTISLSGKAGDFTGQCEAMSGDAPAKF